ncbi:MAG: hypothetical protein A2817_01290 [Candidatus Yanofskybacteria bacterium RIFCSPHIGHO2_01_FULL_39_8b]|uniref:Pyruvoyl-dependent arginine decarboxylase AaxB n=1 Tax=Candidatus Yanofskybacteria bacterium RIFCSPHIGHO2_01_FULL_39_8b TaxID=1802659 RepID=A0A1F8EAX8_9BACT|nr:MAG: hypothetical protein A2817_01290 [Candidatus Yanofskybacteria bacterium RIFCSPHIGHO2_01_FULL_39_8b]
MKDIIVGNRVPYEYFVACGVGESDNCTHAGSFHLALADAGIERYNLMTYSSILPAIATEVEKPIGYVHGSVLETIMARVDGEKSERLTAGIQYGWLIEGESEKKYGGLVVEYMGHGTEQEAQVELDEYLKELYSKADQQRLRLENRRTIIKSVTPSKKYGTTLVALGFVSYVWPVIEGKKGMR